MTLKHLPKLPPNYHAHPIQSFVNGTATLSKAGKIKIPLEFDLESLGSKYQDVRAVLEPWDNEYVPLLVFYEQGPEAVEVKPEPNPALAVLKYVMQLVDDDSSHREFYDHWLHGDFEKCREQWPEAPDECYIGAEEGFVPRAERAAFVDKSAETLNETAENRDKSAETAAADDLLMSSGAVDDANARLREQCRPAANDELMPSPETTAALSNMRGHVCPEEYIVILQSVVENWEAQYNWDGKRYATRAEAVKAGWAARGSDDFNIGVVRGANLVDFCWMGTSIGESEATLAEIQQAISL